METIAQPSDPKVYVSDAGRAVIEHAGSVITLSADEMLTVISELRLCYHHCASWIDFDT